MSGRSPGKKAYFTKYHQIPLKTTVYYYVPKGLSQFDIDTHKITLHKYHNNNRMTEDHKYKNF